MAIAQHVHIPPHDAVTEEVRLRVVRRWFKGPHSGTWILVIENADNEADEATVGYGKWFDQIALFLIASSFMK